MSARALGTAALPEHHQDVPLDITHRVYPRRDRLVDGREAVLLFQREREFQQGE